MVQYTWFPGHMAKALNEMRKRIKAVDLIVEVRDARVPFSSANPKLEELTRGKRRVVVLNKEDLCDLRVHQAIANKLSDQGYRVVTSCAHQLKSVRKVLDTCVSWLRDERPNADMSLMMVMGVPNCGKSSIINALKVASQRTGNLEGCQAYNKTARTGPLPGVTRHMNSFKVSKDPLVYVLDTPGVMLPNLQDNATALKLALTGTVKEAIIDERQQVKMLIQLLMKPYNTTELQRAISAHLKAAEHDEVPFAYRVGRLLYASTQIDPAAAEWYPSVEEDLVEPLEVRLNYVLHNLQVAGALDPSRRLGVYIKLLNMFRGGELGRYTLDEVEDDPRETEAGLRPPDLPQRRSHRMAIAGRQR